MKRQYIGVVAILGIAAFLFGPSPALAQVAPTPGITERFSVLANSAVTGSTGAGTVVTGDVGSSPTPSISNFGPSTVAAPFVLHTTNDLTVQQAHTDAIAVYNFLAAQGPGTVLPAQLDGAAPVPGIYSFTGGAADLADTGTLTLNGGPADVFIFQVDSALTFNVNSNVVGTANPCNVFWRVGTSATLNGVNFRGNIVADASITVGAGANVEGKLLAGTGATGAVTMAGAGGNTIGGCAVAPAGVCPVITLSPASPLPSGTVGSTYSGVTISASGGGATYGYGAGIGLPPGLTLNTSTGAITGTPTTAGTFNFTITGTDTTTFCFGSQVYSMVIAAAVPPGVPALDWVGLAFLVILIGGVGVFLTTRS